MEPITQWVRTSWTKASRGGPTAARRNAAPIAFPLPAAVGPLVHEVVMREEKNFAPHAEHRVGIPAEHEVELRLVDDRLRVMLVANAWGMPRRNRRPPAVLLKPGEWLRWQINYRFSGSRPWGHQWSYRLDTLNIANGPVALDAFLGEPRHLVDERAFLR
jgi:hypothetical protein